MSLPAGVLARAHPRTIHTDDCCLFKIYDPLGLSCCRAAVWFVLGF